MAFLDFLTGSNSGQPTPQQGLPPEHSTVARLLELLGGFTGIAPLAGIGYLADQPTEERYNEAAWPRFKNMLAKSGVPQQKLDNLDLLPMQARVGAANALWQGTLQQQKQQKQAYVPEMLPSGQEAFVDPLTGKVLSTLPQGAYTQSFKPTKTQTGSVKTPFELWRSQNPNGTAQDWQNFVNQGKTTGQKPHELKLVPTMDAEGHPTSTWYDSMTGRPAPSVPPVRGHLNASEIVALEATRSLITDVPKLQATIAPIVAGGPLRQALEYRKYKYPMFGIGGKVDPAYAEYFAQIGNIKSELAKLQTSGTSRSMRLLEFIQDHIPSETDPPQVAVHKLQTLERGRFQSLTKAILGDAGSPDTSLPPGLSDMSGVGTPVYGPDGKVIGFTK